MVKHLFRCPNGHLGLIDDDQFVGDDDIICSKCDFHGYVSDGKVEVRAFL